MHVAKRNKRITSWHLIGAQLATFRKAAGMTRVALADRCCVGEETIASIEQGRRPLQADFAAQLDELLETRGVLQVAVAKVPKKERFPAFVQDFIDYEQDAVTLLWYENQGVPGLLQLEEYIRLVFTCQYPPLEEEEQRNGLPPGSTGRSSSSASPAPCCTSSWRRTSSAARSGTPP